MEEDASKNTLVNRLWPMVTILAGIVLVPLGFNVATSGAGVSGIVVFVFGAICLVTGVAGGIILFADRRHLVPQLLLVIAILVLLAFGLHRYCFSMAYVRGASENPYRLWMSALKPFGGQEYYVGSEGEFSYFRAGAIFPARYKAPTAKTKLPRTFPLGGGQPYAVDESMVHYN